MKTTNHWPKRQVMWIEEEAEGRTLYVSVPFTWNMPGIRNLARCRSMLWDRMVIGGPGVYLCLHFYPDYLEGLPVEVGYSYPGVLQRINLVAVRTTTGCVRPCRFCGIGRGIIEPGGLRELPPDLWRRPNACTIVDNNLLAASLPHFDAVIDHCIEYGWADFEQGLDVRLLTEYYAVRIAEIPAPTVRLALDNAGTKDDWQRAFDLLRAAGVKLHDIRSYVLIGFDSDPSECWERCGWVEEHGVKALPMWYHRLDALRRNVVTPEQAALGWTDYERRRIMQWYYQHKEAVRP